MSERNTVIRSLHDIGVDTCQWLIPAFTGGISVLTALAGEQQLPEQQAAGVLAKSTQWLHAAA